MIVASWNIRGLHRPLKQKSVRTLVYNKKIDVLGILESKLDCKSLATMMRIHFPGMSVVHNFDFSDKGRILIIWNHNSTTLNVLDIGDQFIHAEIKCLLSEKVFIATFVYGFNILVKRRPLWNELKNFGIGLSMPWLVLGDFNNVLSPNEKKGGLMVKNYETKDFVDCVASLDLIDVKSIGCFYTWMSPKVCSKLDRVMVNNMWITSALVGLAEFVAPGCSSDHTITIVSCIEEQKTKEKIPFKFLNMWTLCEDFLTVVSRKWKFGGYGTAQFRLKELLGGLKTPLKHINNKHFSHISSRANKAKERLLVAQHESLTTGMLDVNMKEIRIEAERLLEAERLFLAQKAKCNFLKQGDRCTKFFHDLIKRNKRRNSILAIQDELGNNISDGKLIVDKFVEHYKKLLGTSVTRSPLNLDTLNDGAKITHEQWPKLIEEVDMNEVRDALFDIENEKAPGPDGYGSYFFKSSWSIIAKDVFDAVNEFFLNGRILRQFNHATIALIPKKGHPLEINDYRPISCCNVVYKIISKILVKRLRDVMGSIVDKAQAAFISDRSIVDNIHLAQELLRKYARKRSSPRCTLKVDIQKAYDTVNWDFLHDVLNTLNFPPMMIRWIMECVTTTTYSLLINGKAHGFFKGGRGLRQGDPLSPFLFALCLEVLSRSLKHMSRTPVYGFHPKCQNLRITHIAYADDLLLFARGDIQSVSLVMNCLNEFGDMAGLRVNHIKSSIYMASMEDWVREHILHITGFSCGQLPFRYLGIPLSSSKLNSSDYGMLLDAVRSKINSWPRHTLSHAGKLELIRSVLQGVECFWLSILPMPKNIIDEIRVLCRKFVWSTKHPPIAWDMLHKTRDDGGWGLKDLVAWNKALLAKTIWKIQEKKDSMWIKWVNQYYGSCGSIWEWNENKEMSPLIKQLIGICTCMVNRVGTVQLAKEKLSGWFGGSNGMTKAYDFFVNKVGKWPWKPLIWKSCILPKHRFILWLYAHGKLLTKDRQCYVEAKSCVLCGKEEESLSHLFFKCSVSMLIWNAIREWLGMHKLMLQPSSVLRAFRGIYRGNSSIAKARVNAVAACVYAIWNARNRAIFEGERPIVDDIIRKIMIVTCRCSPCWIEYDL